WAPLVKEGLNELVGEAIRGVRAMPPRGGDPSLTDEEVARAVAYMANQSGARFKQPAASSQKADGRKVYETTCSACHASGVAGAPPRRAGTACMSASKPACIGRKIAWRPAPRGSR